MNVLLGFYSCVVVLFIGLFCSTMSCNDFFKTIFKCISLLSFLILHSLYFTFIIFQFYFIFFPILTACCSDVAHKDLYDTQCRPVRGLLEWRIASRSKLVNHPAISIPV